MTETVSTAPPHVAPPHAPETAAPALATRPGRWIDNWDPENEEQWETGRAAPSPAATCAGRSSPSSSASSSGSSGAIVVVALPAAGFDAHHRRDLLAHLDPEPRRVPPCGSRTRSSCRSSAAATGPSSRPALLLIPIDRAGRVRVEPRDPVRRAAARGGPRRLRRRQLRQLDVEHHLLLPAAGEGLGARPQRRRRQPRCIRRPVRRADRHHDRRRRRAEPARRRLDLGPVHPARDVRRLRGTWTTSPTRRPTSRARPRRSRNRTSGSCRCSTSAPSARSSASRACSRSSSPTSSPSSRRSASAARRLSPRVPRRPRRLARPPLRRPALRPLRRRPHHDGRLRRHGHRSPSPCV